MRPVLSLSALVLSATAALAQSINIDIDLQPNAAGAGAPSNSFAGAATQTGVWNKFDLPMGAQMALKNTAGANTAVTMQTGGIGNYYDFDHASLSGDMSKLLEDGWQVDTAIGAALTFTFNNLAAGRYFLYTYADEPSSSSVASVVTVNGQSLTCGGSFTVFVNGGNYTRHIVDAVAGQPITVSVTKNAGQSGRAFVAGFQIVPAPTRLYVRGNAPAGGNGLTWATAFQNPQEAFDAAPNYFGAVEAIWVAGGTYYTPSVPILGYTFDLPSGVRVLGGFAGAESQESQRNPAANPTYLSGSIGTPSVDDNAWHVVSAWSCNYATLLDGFTITGGNADQPQNPWDGFGGGAYIRDSQLTIRNCTFVGNRGWRGGAVAIENSNPRLEDCLFFNNTADQVGGAILTLTGGAADVVGCDFRFNHATVNYGGAIAHYEGTNINVFNCRFMNNDCGWGGGAIFTERGNCIVANCTFTGNRGNSDRGGAIHTFGDNTYLFVYNCTVVGNSNFQCGGIDAFAGAQVYVRNSIIYGNTDADPATNLETAQLRKSLGDGSLLSVNYCNVEGWSAILGGTGNFGAAPQFVDADGADNAYGTIDDDVRLMPTSPCIDRGSNSLLPADYADVDDDNNVIEFVPLDLDGNARRIDDPATADAGAGTAPIVDLGAYEFVPPCDLAGDLDNDGDVDLTDLATLLSHFGAPSGMTHADGDTDGDGDVDLTDLASLLAVFGSSC